MNGYIVVESRVRAFRTTFRDIVSIVFAVSAGRARMVTAYSANEAGYMRKANPALVHCVRAPEHDLDEIPQGIKEEHCYGEKELCLMKKSAGKP